MILKGDFLIRSKSFWSFWITREDAREKEKKGENIMSEYHYNDLKSVNMPQKMEMPASYNYFLQSNLVLQSDPLQI